MKITMKAVQISSYGGNEVVEVTEKAEVPKVTDDQVLVEVRAASINPIDGKIRAGYLKEMAPLTFPVTLGGDFAGVVTQLGKAVDGFNVGDEVYGQAIVLGGGSGSFAEYVAAKAGSTALKPTAVDFTEAAALPLAGVSAVQALEEHIELARGQKILIHGGAGGIGHLAVQLGKALGAYVAATVSGEDREFVKSLGADEVVDYKKERFEEKLRDFDAVFDTVGGEVADRSFGVLKKGGVMVSMLGEPNPDLARKRGVTGVGQFTRVTTERLKRLKELVDGGKMRVQVEKTFPLAEVKKAFEYQEQGHPRGKVVLLIRR